MIEELTERELEVVAGVARGLTNQGIGSSLGISVETVKTHVVNAKDKLGAADRTQLAVMALLYGLIDPLGCCLLYTSPSPRDLSTSRMPSSA